MREPPAGLVEKSGGLDLGSDWDLRPRFVPDLKEAAEGAVLGEGDVALEEELIESAGSGWLVRWR